MIDEKMSLLNFLFDEGRGNHLNLFASRTGAVVAFKALCQRGRQGEHGPCQAQYFFSTKRIRVIKMDFSHGTSSAVKNS